MKQTVNLDNFIGNPRIVEVLKRAIEQDRLPHALIFAGPAGIGKCTLALLTAQILNCLSPVNNSACGECSSCKKISATLKSRNLPCLSLKGEGFCGTCENCRLRMQKHPDVRLIEPEKTTISINQVRELIDEVAFQPFEARYRLAVLDPADQMKIEAQNSLLKTLEEPASRTVIILITTNPYMLLETIRSRARLLQFGEIPRETIEKYLISEVKMTLQDAQLSAALSGGSLAAAMTFDTTCYREIREQAFRFVKLLLKGEDFTNASSLAAQAAKDKKSFVTWVDAVMALLEDIYYAVTAPERIGQGDLHDKLEQIARNTPRGILVSAIDAVGNLKRELQYNINRQLALEAMFLKVGSP
ncbi:MAG: DNA polymerase III subunit [Acidobacteria bacterium]|nr:DNA polymerase III subunit [Acidobacteriota bacterium]